MMKEILISGIGIGLAGLALTGCAVDGMEGEEMAEDVEEMAQMLGLECESALPTAVFNGGIDYTSPQSYNTTNCYKGVVLDVNNYSSIYTLPGDIPGQTAVEWADAAPTTQSACQSLVTRAYLFQWVNNDWQYITNKVSYGAWTSFFGSYFCSAPGVSFTTEMQAGNKYRIAASARTYDASSAPTRKLHVESRERVIIY